MGQSWMRVHTDMQGKLNYHNQSYYRKKRIARTVNTIRDEIEQDPFEYDDMGGVGTSKPILTDRRNYNERGSYPNDKAPSGSRDDWAV